MTTTSNQPRTAPTAGDIVVEPATGRRYAIGKTGFLDLTTGSFLPYDAAFPGPSFFDRPEVEIETPGGKTPNMNSDVAEVLDTFHHKWTRFITAQTPAEQAFAFTELHATVGDLITWHPDYDYEYEHAQMPWQRATQD